ncbi:MAG: NAD-binding protein [Burkholderiales bacterium]|nr:NAD-binding protein [Burkholderiales bacterium]
MGDILFLVLRRLRAPLITIICVYAISVGGLVLIPGVDAAGKPETMGFFHAFYVMSYTATTIGFGELPNPFTDAQRLWVTFSIYLSVVAWAYALGSVFALTSNTTFRSMLARGVFNWRARDIGEPFYLLCGYGQSGAALARALDRQGARLVVIEAREDKVERMALDEFVTPPLALAADARLADVLEDAGVRNPRCLALIALAGDDGVNQAIAIGARVLNPELPIVARAKSNDAELNLAAFEGVRVINPFETFAENLRLTLGAPEVLQAEEWLTGAPGSACPACIALPRRRWVLVGFGRFGHAISALLDDAGIPWKAFDPSVTDDDEKRLIRGAHAEHVLHDAGIEDADVLVAGAGIDAVNLGVTTLARRLNPGLFVIIRQNNARDRALIEAARADIRFVQSELVVHECLQILTTPMLGRFIAMMRAGGADMARAAMERVRAASGEAAPLSWTFACDVMEPGMFAAFFQRAGEPLCLRHLLADPTDPREPLAATALLLERAGAPRPLPAPETVLKPGDRVLFVGDDAARRLQLRYLREPGTVAWVCSGREPPRSLVFRWWHERRQGAA